MRYEITFIRPDDTEDKLIVEGETLEELRERVQEEMTKRNSYALYSTKIED